MPNDVFHKMIIEGTPEQLNELYVRLDPQPYETGQHPEQLRFNLFEAFLPMPEEVRSASSEYRFGKKVLHPAVFEKYGVNDWYEWVNANWGTKWGTYATNIVREDNRLILTFCTAWSSPHEFYAQHLEGLRFAYRAHEESRERLIEGNNDGVRVVPPGEVEEQLMIWAFLRGGDLSKYIETESDGSRYVDYYTLSDDWMNDLKEAQP